MKTLPDVRAMYQRLQQLRLEVQHVQRAIEDLRTEAVSLDAGLRRAMREIEEGGHDLS